MTTDLHDLLGAYAVDALPPEEVSAFEAHLQECPDCGAQASELVAVAGRLGASFAVAPPAWLWDAVSERIDAAEGVEPSALPDREHLGGSRRSHARSRTGSRWIPVGTGILAAAATTTAIVLGVNLVDMTEQRDATIAQATGVSGILAAPDAEVIRADGLEAAAVISRAQDAAAFVGYDFDQLGEEQDYQLWMIGEDEIVSLGVFDAETDGRTLPIAASGLGETTTLGVTIEPQGGSDQPTSTPIGTIEL